MSAEFQTALLMRSDEILTTADVACTPNSRRKGFIGRTNFDRAMVITQCKWIHTFGVKTQLDIAYVDASGAVIKIQSVQPFRMCAPVSRCKTVVEAGAGSFERWNLRVGDVIEIRPA